MSMNAAEQLRHLLMDALPDAAVHIDVPAEAAGHWWIDARRGMQTIAVEWRPEQGFGVHFGPGGYGEGPDVVLQDVNETAERVVRFLRAPDVTDEALAAGESVAAGLSFQRR